jgi:hypothetical protein
VSSREGGLEQALLLALDEVAAAAGWGFDLARQAG